MNEKMIDLGNNRSIIRELFEFSKKRKQEIGAQNVFDFSIGNPSIPPAEQVTKVLIELLNEEDPCSLHGYTSAQGDIEVRKEIAEDLNRRYQTTYSENEIYMTCGAAASLCIVFRALVDSVKDEILAIAPYFTEYKVFVESTGATLKVVSADTTTFDLNIKELEKNITPNTKGIIINSPNNPSGVIIPEKTLQSLAKLLNKKQKEYQHPIYIISDEPYREIVYDHRVVPHIPSIYTNTIICYSYSKSLSLPGERIGYILVPNTIPNHQEIYAACIGAGRAYGYVCAPSLFQKMIVKCASLTSDMTIYEQNRNLLYEGLTKLGYECVYPQGAFYLFVKSLDPDANRFMERAKSFNIILVPSDSFGVKGYVRIAYCVSKDTIIRSLPQFEKLMKSY